MYIKVENVMGGIFAVADDEHGSSTVDTQGGKFRGVELSASYLSIPYWLDSSM